MTYLECECSYRRADLVHGFDVSRVLALNDSPAWARLVRAHHRHGAQLEDGAQLDDDGADRARGAVQDHGVARLQVPVVLQQPEGRGMADELTQNLRFFNMADLARYVIGCHIERYRVMYSGHTSGVNVYRCTVGKQSETSAPYR